MSEPAADTNQLLTELNLKLAEVNQCFQVLGKATADQHILLMRMLATQASNFAVLRALLAGDEQRNKQISQQLRQSFQHSLEEFEAQLVAYDKSHDAMKFLSSFVLFDEEPKVPPSHN